MPDSRAFTLLELLIIISLALILWAILVPNFMRARARGQLTACKSNLKNIATALEMYASDNQGAYPSQLQRLTGGNYLKVIPTCPAAGKVTYEASYHKGVVPPWQGEFYSFYCQGNNHGRSYTGFSNDSTNYPQYDARVGLLDHP